jgi:hypothetical protein
MSGGNRRKKIKGLDGNNGGVKSEFWRRSGKLMKLKRRSKIEYI